MGLSEFLNLHLFLVWSSDLPWLVSLPSNYYLTSISYKTPPQVSLPVSPTEDSKMINILVHSAMLEEKLAGRNVTQLENKENKVLILEVE